MLRLLGRATSGNVQKVVFLLEELGSEYQREDYGRQFENTTTPEYLALNPNGKVPTLLDGDLAIWESNTILRYLARQARSDLYPSDFAARSQVERWMDWQLATVNPLYMTIFKESRKPEAERMPSLPAVAAELDEALSLLDAQIGAGPWILGDSFSLADTCLGPIVHRCLGFPVTLGELAAVRGWRDRLLERPAFKTAVEV